MEFYQTGYGRKFFDGQLPQLIRSIESVGKAIENQQTKTIPTWTIYYREGTTLQELDLLFAKESVIVNMNSSHRFIRIQTDFTEAELLLFPFIERAEK